MRTFALIVIALGACGGGGNGGISADNLAEELGRVTCARLAECCTPEEFMDETLGNSVADCEALYLAFGSLLENTIEDSIAAGRLIYHPDRMADCMAAIEAAACPDFQTVDLTDGCEDPFEGTVAAGGQCANDIDCISEFCVGDSTDLEGNVTLGQCADAPGVGQPCADGDCGAGAYCESTADGQICQAQKADGAECNLEEECASGACNGAETGQGTCGVPMTCDGM